MGTISSSGPATSARPSAGWPTDAAELDGALRRAPAGVRRRPGAVRGHRPRRARRATPSTLHVVGVADGAVAGAVRLYPLDDAGLWKGDRLAVLPEARVRQLGALLVRFAVATAGERGGHTMVAQIQLPNVRFFEHLGWSADGPPAPYHGVMHQPMAIPLAASPVRGVLARSQTGASRAAGGEAQHARVVERAARRAGQAAALEHRAGRVDVLGARGEQEAEARERQQPALERRAVRARQAVEVERARRSRRPRSSAAASRRCRASRRRARRGRGPASATSTSASPSSRSCSGARSCSAVKNGSRLAHVPAVERERGEQDVAGRGRRRAQRPSGRRRCTTPTAPARAPIVRWPPTTGTPSRSAAQAIPSSTRSACARSGLTSMSTSASGRPPIARTSETFVTTAAEPAPYGSAAGTAARSPRRRRRGTRRRAARARRRRRRCRRRAARSAATSRLPSRPGADRTASTSAWRSAIGGH